MKRLKDKNSFVRLAAACNLGELGAKEYADEIGKLINDSSVCYIQGHIDKSGEDTIVSAEVERVLKEWGYDTEKLKEKK